MRRAEREPGIRKSLDELVTPLVFVYDGVVKLFEKRAHDIETALTDPELRHDALSLFASIPGINPEAFISASEMSCSKQDFAERLVDNAGAALALALERPDAVRALSDKFGIQAFARYPREMLIQQYDNIDNTKDPYGILMYPRLDHDGAFYGNQAVYSDFLKDCIAEGYQFRVFETGSRIEVVRRLVEAETAYGAHKISFAIVGGHGNENTLRQGKVAERGDIGEFTSDTVSGKGVENAIKRFFVEMPAFVFDSCCVGADNAIGQIFAEENDTEVFAVNQPASLKSLHCHKDEKTGRLGFEVTYESKEGDAVQARHLLGNELGGRERRATERENRMKEAA